MIVDPKTPGLRAGAFIRWQVSTPHRYLNVLYVDKSQGAAQILVSELYRMKDGTWELHTSCPVCARAGRPHGLRVTSSRTSFGVEGNEVRTDVFRCLERAEFGGRCAFSGAIEPPPRGMEQFPGPDGAPVRIDAVLIQRS